MCHACSGNRAAAASRPGSTLTAVGKQPFVVQDHPRAQADPQEHISVGGPVWRQRQRAAAASARVDSSASIDVLLQCP